MNISKQSKVETLSEWLKVATKNLEETAKVRIQKEIDAHYAEAVEAYLSDGFSEAEAQGKALVDLGDAKNAAKQLRRQHLTKSDIKLLKGSEKEGRSFALLFVSYLFFFAYIAENFGGKTRVAHYWPFYLATELLGLCVFPTWCFFAAKRDIGRARKVLLLLQPVSGVVFGVFCEQMFNPDRALGPWYDASLGLILLGRALGCARLWKKLGKIGDSLSKDPLLDPAQA